MSRMDRVMKDMKESNSGTSEAVTVGVPTQIQTQLAKQIEAQTKTYMTALANYFKGLESALKSQGCTVNMGLTTQSHHNNSANIPSMTYQVSVMLGLPKDFPTNPRADDFVNRLQDIHNSVKQYGDIGFSVKDGFVNFTPNFKMLPSTISYHFS